MGGPGVSRSRQPGREWRGPRSTLGSQQSYKQMSAQCTEERWTPGSKAFVLVLAMTPMPTTGVKGREPPVFTWTATNSDHETLLGTRDALKVKDRFCHLQDPQNTFSTATFPSRDPTEAVKKSDSEQ